MASIDTFVQRFDLTAAICWLLTRPPRLIAGDDLKVIRAFPKSCLEGTIQEAERRWRESKTPTYATGLEFSKAMKWLCSRIALPNSNGVEFYKYFGALEVSRMPDSSIVAIVAPKLQEFDNVQRRRSLWEELLANFPYLMDELKMEIDNEWAIDIYRRFCQLRNIYEVWDETTEKPDGYTLRMHESACGRLLLRSILEGALSEKTPVVPGAWWLLNDAGVIELVEERGNRRLPIKSDAFSDEDSRGIWKLAVDTWLGPYLPSIIPKKGPAVRPSEQSKYRRGASACTMISERIRIACQAGTLLQKQSSPNSQSQLASGTQLDLEIRAHILANAVLYRVAGQELDNDFSPEAFFRKDHDFASSHANYPGPLPTLADWLPVAKRVGRVVSELQNYLHAVKGLPSAMTAGKVLLIHWVLTDEGCDVASVRLTEFQDWSVGDVPHIMAHAGAYDLTDSADWIECVRKSLTVMRTVTPTPTADLPMLSPKASAVYELLLALPEHRGMTGPEIVEALPTGAMMDESTLRKSVIPALKPYGLEHVAKIGYRIMPSRRRSSQNSA